MSARNQNNISNQIYWAVCVNKILKLISTRKQWLPNRINRYLNCSRRKKILKNFQSIHCVLNSIFCILFFFSFHFHFLAKQYLPRMSVQFSWKVFNSSIPNKGWWHCSTSIERVLKLNFIWWFFFVFTMVKNGNRYVLFISMRKFSEILNRVICMFFFSLSLSTFQIYSLLIDRHADI